VFQTTRQVYYIFVILELQTPLPPNLRFRNFCQLTPWQLYLCQQQLAPTLLAAFGVIVETCWEKQETLSANHSDEQAQLLGGSLPRLLEQSQKAEPGGCLCNTCYEYGLSTCDV